ncbi:YciI family protein, partial [uncultured Prochlorococcus sp.]|uniref:YciI family protein n=1 Tax=uncultured Prochlorococcus sp. TaxID=159733 RepID=UPI002590B280
MEKFVVFGKYCEDAIIKRTPFREQHLNRLKKLKDRDILVTLGPTKCSKYLFGIFQAKNKNQLINLIEQDIYWEKGI